MKLTAENVNSVMTASLFKAEEVLNGVPPDDAIIVEGLMSKYGFHPDRLSAHKDDIREMLKELPDDFHISKGGGMSFLNGCMDKDGNQWGEQRTVEALVCLGIGADLAGWLLKDMASVLPGGVPYFEVHP